MSFKKIALLFFIISIVNSAFAMAEETAVNSELEEEHLSAEDILKKADHILAPECFTAEMTMTSYLSNGESRKYKMKIYHKSKNMVLVAFYYPNIENGRKILRLNNDIWMYMPSVKKNIKVSSKEQLFGGDFTNGDITKLDFASDYFSSIIPQLKNSNNYLLQLGAKNNAVSYDRILYLINKNNFMPLKQSFYTASKKMIKELSFHDIKNYGELSRPSRFVMSNRFINGKKTELSYTSFQILKNIDDFYFKKDNLGDF